MLRSACLACGRGPLVLFAVLSGCASPAPPTAPAADGGVPAAVPCTGTDFAGAPFGVRCNALVDPEGRTVLLHGVNARVDGLFDVTFADGRAPLHEVPAFEAGDARRIAELGYDAIRLPINWSGLEPTETGGLDAGYLARLDATLATCEAARISVLLSLHQDGYSKEIGQDGAPLWAIRPPPGQLLGGPLDSLEGRAQSPQVLRAFATFFGDTADGVYLRARYAQMLAAVLTRYADSATVLGVDVFNEPVATDARVVASYKGILPALRAAAPKKLFFFEPAAIRNLTDFAPPGDGELAPGTVYGPHVYTAVFDRDDARRRSIGPDELLASNERARSEADGYRAPLAIGEFGFDHRYPNFEAYVRGQARAQEAMRASSFLWLWKEQSQGSWGFFDIDPAGRAYRERPAVLAAHARVRVHRVSGELARVVFDEQTRALRVDLERDAAVTAPNVVTFGATAGYEGGRFAATCDGAVLSVAAGDPANLPCGGPDAHVLVVRPGA